MDDQTTMRAYGNTSLPESTPDRPLVTFALFAYNQEEYVRRAVQGAFSQTYSPLEIILSDDCSSDRTFAIMEEMAREYRGPHLVLVRKNHLNLRPYSHVLEAVKVSRGDPIVLAAGDDVSKPDRVQKIVELSRISDCWAFHSRFDLIDENGDLLAESERSESLFASETEFHKYFHRKDGPISIVHGATSAYRRKLLSLAPEDQNGILSEDGVFTILLNLIGKQAAFLEDSLVMYRLHSQAISNVPSGVQKASLDHYRRLLNRQKLYAKNIADRACLALRFQAEQKTVLRSLNVAYLKDEIVVQRATYAWQSLTILERISAVGAAYRQRRIGYVIPTILGNAMGPVYLHLRHRLLKLGSAQ
jgi:cellulose synthase/poly-beta-1,6-N-acetylglucosamine synthase-like glycosyltransferase